MTTPSGKRSAPRHRRWVRGRRRARPRGATAESRGAGRRRATRGDLRIAPRVTLAHACHLGCAEHRFRVLPHDGARLGRKVRRRTDDHHGFNVHSGGPSPPDRRGLDRGHVEQHDAAAARTDRLHARDLQMTEERGDVERALTKRGRGGASPLRNPCRRAATAAVRPRRVFPSTARCR